MQLDPRELALRVSNPEGDVSFLDACQLQVLLLLLRVKGLQPLTIGPSLSLSTQASTPPCYTGAMYVSGRDEHRSWPAMCSTTTSSCSCPTGCRCSPTSRMAGRTMAGRTVTSLATATCTSPGREVFRGWKSGRKWPKAILRLQPLLFGTILTFWVDQTWKGAKRFTRSFHTSLGWCYMAAQVASA